MDETFLDQKGDSERIRSLSTSNYYKVEVKGQDRQEIEFFGKFDLCSNNEDNFILSDPREIRYWIRKFMTFVSRQFSQQLIKFLDVPQVGEKKKILRHEIKTRVNAPKFKELSELLEKTNCKRMSELVRDILHNKAIRDYTVDDSFAGLMEEVRGIRKELKTIGININQVTRYFHSEPDATQKLVHSFQLIYTIRSRP